MSGAVISSQIFASTTIAELFAYLISDDIHRLAELEQKLVLLEPNHEGKN